jgi:amino acid adenylation domain-containing protein
MPEKAIDMLKATNGFTATGGGMPYPDSAQQGVDQLDPAKIAHKSESTAWLPLTAYQQRIWNADQFLQDASYHIPVVWRITGTLDVSALQIAWLALQQRHEALRVRVAGRDSGVMQRIVSSSATASLAPLRCADPGMSKLDDLIANETRKRFALELEPPIRACLVRRAEDEHLLLVTVHHVIADGWTVGLLAKDLSSCYAAAVATTDVSSASPVGIPLSALVADEKQRSAARPDSDNYWKASLAQAFSGLQLPFDRPVSAGVSTAGDSVAFEISALVSTALKDFAFNRGSTVFTVLVSVLQGFLQRITGQQHIRIGYPVARRSGASRARTAGCLINTLVLSAEIEPTDTFEKLVAQNREQIQQAHAHEDVLIERLPNFSHSSPLFDVLLNFNKFDEPTLRLTGLSVETLARRSLNSPYSLAWIVSDVGTSYGGRLEFQTDKFDRATIERLLDHWLTFLHSSLSWPNQPIRSLDIMRLRQAHDLLALGKISSAPNQGSKFVHQLFEFRAQTTPEATAVVCDDLALTYGQLNGRANRIASKLLAAGVSPETPIAVCVSRGVNQAVCLLAVLKSGGMYLPIDPLGPVQRMQQVLLDASVCHVLTDLAHAPRFAGYVIHLVDAQGDHAAPTETENLALTISPANAAYCLYTSGSTGTPKGVVVTCSALEHHIRAANAAYAICTSDTILQFASAAFDTSLEQLLIALTSGAKAIIRGDTLWSMDELENKIREHRITVADIPASYWYLLSRSNLGIASELGLRLLIVGGEAVVAPSVAVRALAHLSLNAYGPTEAAMTCTIGNLEDVRGCLKPYVAIGRPLPGTSIRILDKQLQIVPLGIEGEIFIVGDRLARGYLRQPAMTAERFIPDPFGSPGARMYRSGDLARWLSGGRIEFLGRRDQQVKVRGVRIELGEIEAVLLAHSQVRNAAALVVGDADEVCLLACVVLYDGQVALKAVQRHVRLELPEGMQPTRWQVMESFPLTPQGKVDRSALASLTSASAVGATDDFSTGAGGQNTLKEILSILHKLAPVTVQDVDSSLNELGIHSMAIIRLIAACQECFGVTLKPRDVLKAGTVRRIAERIDLARQH